MDLLRLLVVLGNVVVAGGGGVHQNGTSWVGTAAVPVGRVDVDAAAWLSWSWDGSGSLTSGAGWMASFIAWPRAITHACPVGRRRTSLGSTRY